MTTTFLRGILRLSYGIFCLFPENKGTQQAALEKNTKALDGVAMGAGSTAILGGGLGLLIGIGALAIPGVGLFSVAGPIFTTLAGAGVGGVIGGITGALIGMSIPEYGAKRQEVLVMQEVSSAGEVPDDFEEFEKAS